MSQLERIFWLDAQIQGYNYPNAQKLAEKFEISRRQAYADREYMVNRLSAPIGYNRERGGWYYTDPTYRLPAILLQEGELLAFLLTQQLSSHYLGTPFERQFESALQKIRAHLPDTVTVQAEDLSHMVAFTGGATVEADPKLVMDLNKAACQQRQVRMKYYTASRGEVTERVVDPYRLHNVQGDWYLIAYCHSRHTWRDFLLVRIREWEILDQQFERSPTFNLQDYLERGFRAERGEKVYDIAVRFDAYQARWVKERRYHATQSVEPLPDGGVILRLRTGALDEVARWVLQYGPHAEALEPQELRCQVAEAHRSAAKSYDRTA